MRALFKELFSPPSPLVFVPLFNQKDRKKKYDVLLHELHHEELLLEHHGTPSPIVNDSQLLILKSESA